MTRVQRAHARRRAMSQDGFGAYWLAITCVLILAAGALAVDLGYAYVENQRTQDAADAAALGGTIFLPSDPTLASARAQQLAIENGFDPSDPNVHISVTPVAGQLTQLKVTITKRIPVFFAGILGYDHMTITRTATADYDQPVQMGSPASSFGNQPDCAGQCTSGDPTPDFWANVEGPQTFKHNGNAFMGGYCTGGISDNCAGEGLNNSDLQSDGAVFAIRNRVPGSAVRIDLFDAPFVNVGDVCPDTDPNSGGPSALAVLAAFLGNNPRYTPGAWPQSQYCTGDVLIPTPASSQPVVTQYRVFQPDATPWTLADNVPESACPTLTFTGAADAISGYIDPTTQAAWRQWYTMCTISNPVAGDYMLQVRTLSGAGNNNFSVRVASGGSLSSSNVSVFGQGRMAIYANSAAGQNNTTFYFARVLPGAAGALPDTRLLRHR